MTVVVTALFRPKPDHRDDLVAALRSTMPAVHAEPGCALYAIHGALDEVDGTITMIEKWDSVDDLDAHGSGAAVAALSAAVQDHLAGPVEVVRMIPIAAGDPDRGSL